MIGPKLYGAYALRYKCVCGHVDWKPTNDAPKDLDAVRHGIAAMLRELWR